MRKAAHLKTDRKQRIKERPFTDHMIKAMLVSELLPPFVSHLLRFPEPPKRTPPAGYRQIVHESMRAFHIQAIKPSL